MISMNVVVPAGGEAMSLARTAIRAVLIFALIGASAPVNAQTTGLAYFGNNQRGQDGFPSQVWGFSIDGTSGTLNPISGSPFQLNGVDQSEIALGQILDSLGRFLYVETFGSSGNIRVFVFTIDRDSGALDQPNPPAFMDPQGDLLGFDSMGRFAYVPSFAPNGSVDLVADTVDPDSGALTRGNLVARVAGTTSGVVDPSGQFLYTTDDSDKVWGLRIDSGTGGLMPVPGSPFPGGSHPSAIAIDPTSQFLYAVSRISGSFVGYRIDSSTGSLTPIAGLPSFGGSPNRMTVDPTGQFLYISWISSDGQIGQVYGYRIDPATGVLTAVPNSPFLTRRSPMGIVVDPSGQFVFIAGQDGISSFILSSDGTLVPNQTGDVDLPGYRLVSAVVK